MIQSALGINFMKDILPPQFHAMQEQGNIYKPEASLNKPISTRRLNPSLFPNPKSLWGLHLIVGKSTDKVEEWQYDERQGHKIS